MSKNSPLPPHSRCLPQPLGPEANRPQQAQHVRSAFVLLSRLLVVVSCGGMAAAQDAAQVPVRYSVSFGHAANHYIHVEAHFPSADPQQELFLPVWTPGSYLVREYAQHIDSVEASAVGEDGSQHPVGIKKMTKNRWQLANEQSLAVTVGYRIYCNELSVRTNFVDREFGLLNGAATFMTADKHRGEEQIVELNMPTDWKQSVSAMERRVQLGPHTFVAASYDELVDSPLVLGNPTLHPFEVGGVQHFLVNQGGEGLWNGEQAAADVAKIVEVHQEMWGQVPYDHYYFLNVIAESGGGLEHDNSTLMLTSRWNFRDKKRYQSWLGLVSHEFFHTWNVRRLRPQALATYDYEVENYFDELWVAEGVTSYYDDLALARAGHTTTKEYLAALSKQITTFETSDGRFKQSLAEASHDAWIKYYRPNENSRNNTISYYNKGAIVGFLLDLEIRRATENEKCLDDVMRDLYAKFALKNGYTTQDVIAATNQLTGTDLTAWFEQTIYSTNDLDYQPALDWLGLKFAHQTEPSVEGEATHDKAAEKSAKEAIWTGLVTKVDAGKLLVSAVAESGPAFRAGLNVGDEIIAINNYRMADDLGDRLKQFQDDGEIDVLLSRRGALSHVTLKFEERAVTEWKLGLVSEPSASQKATLAAWLHQSIEADSPVELEKPSEPE